MSVYGWRGTSLLGALCLASAAAGAAPVLMATMGTSKASIAFDGKQEMVTVGETTHGIKLVSVAGDSAVIEVDGQRKTVSLGQGVYGNGGAVNGKVTLYNEGGHFHVEIGTDSGSMRGLIDTGATILALSYRQAMRLGVNIDETTPTTVVGTAQGVIRVWKVKVPSIRIGGVPVQNVDAAVMPGNFPLEPLVGMSVLSHFSMQREGDYMTLSKRF